jgi:hypothetical protein
MASMKAFPEQDAAKLEFPPQKGRLNRMLPERGGHGKTQVLW